MGLRQHAAAAIALALSVVGPAVSAATPSINLPLSPRLHKTDGALIGTCNVVAQGAVGDNATDNTAVFREVAAGCRALYPNGASIIVPPGAYVTGPFNLSSNTTLIVEAGAAIVGSLNPDVYPLVVQLPLDEAYRAPHMHNTQYQALISSYGAVNVALTGGGTIEGLGWTWWANMTANSSNLWAHQRPKLVEFVDSVGVTVRNVTLQNSPFWTLHPIFCTNVELSHLRIYAPRNHGNTDGVDPDSCQNVHVSDVLIDVGDDAVSVKSGLHWRTRQKVPAADYLFERVTILFRNFAIGSSVSGDVRNITFRDSTIGDDLGSSPWAIKLKTDSQEGGVVDGVTFRNVRLGLITFCGSSKFVFPTHCNPGKETGATAIDMGMGYGGLEPTDPGILRNVVFDGVYGVGPTGVVASWRGLPGKPVCGVTVTNVTLKQGITWECTDVSNVTLKDVSPSPKGSCVSTGVGAV
eukprot:m.19697 g.19697  ORF g.19697 m.19697 type:complete len:465 (-) comp5476_c1_seq1:100-1494(-)